MLDFSLLNEVFIALFAASVMLQQAGIQSFIEPITDSLGQFATIIAQVAPKIVPALILLGIGLLASRVIGRTVRKIA
jgi:hypothetical protein